ncbi:hypothetical protein BDN67DRAFT_489364 [Paxillus ammoniavirescens]|nr:hypothetical protein BDN67DRAFT_489364 [Paxillus ammoniavirescens]
MAGANYMGGKRNAARARTKDAAGRAQKRHFGRQRLAAALCMTREDRRIHLSKPTLSSVLPEIDLAHARRDIVDDVPSPVNQAFESVRLHSPPSPNDDKRRRNPSKILVALDTSDHISMRAAIDRILRRPDLVGLRGQGLKQTTNNERIHGPMVVRGSTDFYPDSQVQ